MSKEVSEKIKRAAAEEPFAKLMGITCEEVGEGTARCSMVVQESMRNLFSIAHGGAVFGLLDETFQLACNSRGQAAYALNLSITYVAAAYPGEKLTCEAKEKSLGGRTGVYEFTVVNERGDLIATAQSIAYRKKEAPPFL